MPREDVWAIDASTVQARFRSGNERLRASATSHRFEAEDSAPFVCECADPGCYESVMLTLADYDRVRRQPNWFVVAAGHEDEEAVGERIIEAEHGYTIVENLALKP